MGITMNMIKGKIVRKAGGLAFSGKAVEFFLPSILGKAIWKSKVAINEEVSLGVVPEEPGVENEGDAGRTRPLSATVKLKNGENLNIIFILRNLTGELIRSY